MSSHNIPMSFKINEPLLRELMIFCNNRNMSYSSAIRAGLSLIFAKDYKNNTRNTDLGTNYDNQW